MTLDDESEEYIHDKLFRTRGKCAIYARQSDVYVEVKSRPNPHAGRQVDTMAEVAGNNSALDIGHDVWFHIAMRLDPEDVQTFALVCKQTAKLVNSRVFWRNMYLRHCMRGSHSRSWNLQLPAHLQLEQIRNCDTKVLRAKVIEAFYHCYRPLKTRLELGYNLDWLLHRTFISCSQKQYQCLWIICYTLSNKLPPPPPDEGHSAQAENEVVNDWETLAETDAPPTSSSYRHEGLVLLIVLCRHFMPLPLQLLYNQQQTLYRLKATRELLCTDMRAKNLELDFAEDSNSPKVTVKYSRIEKFKVLPWWHPDFKRFIK